VLKFKISKFTFDTYNLTSRNEVTTIAWHISIELYAQY